MPWKVCCYRENSKDFPIRMQQAVSGGSQRSIRLMSLKKNIEHPIIKIHLACTASLENATLTDWKHEETLEQTLEEELQNRLNTDAKVRLEKGIDISNSYKNLKFLSERLCLL